MKTIIEITYITNNINVGMYLLGMAAFSRYFVQSGLAHLPSTHNSQADGDPTPSY